MEIRLLGPVEVSVDGRPVALGAAKQRALLAVLALHANRTVSAEELIEALWADPPPATAPKMVQQYVSHLRRLLPNGGAAEIRTHGRGYELRVASEAVDVHRFERLVAGGAERAGLALWHGPPLADLVDEPFAAAAIRQLEEQRLSALERAIDAELAAGGHRELIGELKALVARHPLSERLHGQLMLALYRSGRQAEALEAFRSARQTLVEEVGIEPGPALRALHESILRQDVDLPPELDVSSPLIGRTAELQQLRAAWARGGVVVLTGAEGSGRTRLAAELAAEVQREGAVVLYGTGAPDPVRPTLLVTTNLQGPGPFRLVVVLGEARVPGATQIALGPLAVSAVAEIAALYAPADAVIPAERLAAQSGGMPRPAHRLAAEWARGESRRRLAPVADQLAADRGELRRAEHELAGRVTELQAVRERADRRVVVCPFKGLAAYDVADAEYFFGRERLVATMVARLAGAPLLAIVGASGSGKSSALRAGLLAALQRGVLPGSEQWTQALIRPGALPDADLIAVDQFEEIFTRCLPDERGAFIDALTRSDRRIVLAIRADFYGRCGEYPRLAALLAANHVLVGPMQRDELRRVIEQPGWHVEPALTDRLLADTEREPGALPLLSTALLELWERRDGHTLRLAAYEDTGGVRGAVARLAEDAYARLDDGQQAAARRILLRLAGEDDVRRRVALPELAEDRAVLDTLAARRLVTLSDGMAEVAHEALLREWPRLRGWLEQDAEGRRIHHRLADAAREWDAGGRDAGELYRGARLAAALEHADGLNALERAFLAASRRRNERELRRLRVLLASVGVLAVLALAAGALSLDQRGDARAGQRSAEAQRLGALALVEDDLDRSLLLARQGVAIEDSLPTRNNLLAALLRAPAAIHAVRLTTLGLSTVALRPDGRVVLAGDDDGRIHFLDPATGRALRAPYRSPAPYIRQIVFNRDGSRLVIGRVGDIDLFDGRTLKPVSPIAMPGGPDIQYINVAFSPDGRVLMAMYETRGTSVVRRFDGRTGAPLGRPLSIPADSAADAVGFGPGGRWIVTLRRGEHGAVLIRDPRTLAVRRSYPVGYVSGGGALAPDARTFALGGNDGLVRFLDLHSGALTTAFGRHDAAVRALRFTADGRTLISAANDGRAIVWDVRSATARETLTGHAGAISSLAVDRRARTLYTSSGDGSVIVWDLAGDRRVGRPFAAGSTSEAREITITASPDGRTVAVRQADGSVSLVDVATLTRRRVAGGGGSTPYAPAFGAGGTLIAGGEHGFLAILDARTGRVRARLRGHDGTVFTPSVSADGATVATTSDDGTLRLWDVPGGRALGAPFGLGDGAVNGAAISPDGTIVAVPMRAGTLDVFDVRSHRRLAQLRADRSWPSAVRFSRDGRALLVGTDHGNVRVYSAPSLRPSGPAFAAVPSTITTVDASPDDRTLVATGLDGSVRLWDLPSRRAIGRSLPGPDLAAAATFTRGGRHVVAVFADGRGYRWDVRPSAWSRQACAVAGRRLTRAEWADALPGRSYSPAC